MSWKPLLAMLLVVGPPAGFALGRWTAPDAGDGPVLRELARQRVLLEERRAPAPSPSDVRCATPAPALASADLERLRSEVARAVREQLDLRPEARASDVDSRASPPEPTAQNLAALQEGHQLIDHVAQTLRWTPEDRQTLRRVLNDMTFEQREEVMRRLVTTLNGKKLDLRTQGTPF